jgi:Ni,Fe-hydrogenase III large subunit
LLSTPNLLSRTQNVGRLDPQVARDYSPVGPLLRASGFKRDTRVTHPYAAYANVPVNIHTYDGCDVLSRVLIRAEEVHDSLAMIEYCLDQMPEGPILIEGFTYKPHRFALGYAEAPRGEDVHWTMLGDNQKLYRWRCRAPTYANWPVMRHMLRDNTISDAPLIIASIDPCYSCTDRVTFIDVRKRKSTTVPYKEVERYGRERTDSPLK